jgi:hypothetical protein
VAPQALSALQGVHPAIVAVGYLVYAWRVRRR